MAEKILIVVDMQKDFVNGSLGRRGDDRPGRCKEGKRV